MAECYKEAVWADLTCIRAVTSLTSHQMLTLDEVSRPSLARSCPMVTGDLFIWRLSEEILTSLSLSQRSQPMNNFDVRVPELDMRQSSAILKTESQHLACLPIHVVLLVELKKTSNLFRLSHSPVGLFPKWCVAWYAIGGCIAVYYEELY